MPCRISISPIMAEFQPVSLPVSLPVSVSVPGNLAVVWSVGLQPMQRRADLYIRCAAKMAAPQQAAPQIDRGRDPRLPGDPSLRTVRAVLPHTALRSVVHLRED